MTTTNPCASWQRTEISRAEGYRRGHRKEALGVATVRGFLWRHDIPTRLIRSAEDNYQLGDLSAPSRVTIEVKRQPIDPDRYPQNFVEIAEITDSARHEGGFEQLADLLSLTPDELEQIQCRDRRPGRQGVEPLGSHPKVSVSITSLTNAGFTIYVNPGEAGPGHIYVYSRAEIVGSIRRAVRSAPLSRGAGNSNTDTISVCIPVAYHRWTRPSLDHDWEYAGDGTAADAVRHLHTVLTTGGTPTHA